MKKKVVWLPYDFDTALGITNEGTLAFSYNLEDTDQTESGADVFNGQKSVIWNNLRDTFGDVIKAMYQDLRSKGVISYDVVERMFEEHQAKWPEAIFNEDAWFKYLAPLVEQGSAAYLSMLQGSKAEQRKWWLYNRFRYLDSKYNAGDSLSDVIQVRGYAKSDVTVTPYADIYATVKYGSYLVQTRAKRNQAYTLVCPLDQLNDTEIYIYSASQLASVGDLSGLKVGFADFSMATKLQDIKLGDESAIYLNNNLEELYLGNNTLLQKIDVRNCPKLTQTVDLTGCVNIENIYFDGTSVAGVELPNGGQVKILHLPATITSLTLRNQIKLTDLTCPDYSNLTTLWLDRPAACVDYKAITGAMAAGSRVRITGISYTAASVAEVKAWFDVLDTMRGLDEAGNNVDKAQVSGSIYIDADVTGAEMAQIVDKYDIAFTYRSITANVYYYNWEGDTLLHTETVANGGNAQYADRPAHEATAANTFKFIGWSRNVQSTVADAKAQRAVIADRNLYAAYEVEGRRYAVRYLVDGVAVQTTEDVLYGTTVLYTGAEPEKQDYLFNGWTPEVGPITGDTDYTAKWKFNGIISRKIVDGSLTFFDGEGYTDIGGDSLSYLPDLRDVILPDVTQLSGSSMLANSGPSTSGTPFNLVIGTQESTTVVPLTSQYVLTQAPFTMKIYVADSLLESYKTATNWSRYANQIRPMSEYTG